MKKTYIVFICLLMLITCINPIYATQNEELVIYVSNEGNDFYSGTEARPIKTTAELKLRIADADRNIYPNIRVVFKNGEYNIDGFSLNGENNITFEGSEKTVFTNVTTLNGNDFELANNVRDELKGKIYRISLLNYGIKEYGNLVSFSQDKMTNPSPTQLIIDNETMKIAQWPDNGYATIIDVTKNADGSYLVGLDENRAMGWKNANSAWLYGAFYYEWTDDMRRITSYDKTDGKITIPNVGYYGIRAEERTAVKVMNVFEELDTPGEWYADTNTGYLYVYPKNDISSAKIAYSQSSNDIISLTDCSNIAFKNIMLTGTRGNAFNICNSDFVSIQGCRIQNIGRYGINIEECTNTYISECRFMSIGKGGVNITGGDFVNLTAGNNTITNCEFSDFGVYTRKYSFAVKMFGVGDVLSHCTIHNAPHFAVYFLGNDNLIEYNNIYDVVKESRDAGAIYAGRSWTSGGTVIRYNYIHDCDRTYNGSKSAIYLDDWMTDVEVTKNVIYRMSKAISLHSAQYCDVTDNLIVDCNTGIHLNTKNGHSYTVINSVNNDIYSKYINGTLETDYTSVNYMGYTDGLFSKYYERYNPTNSIWNEKYPYLKTLFDDGKAVSPKYDNINRNALFMTSEEYIPAYNPNTKSVSRAYYNCNFDDNYLENRIPKMKEDGVCNLLDSEIEGLRSAIPDFEIIDVNETGVKELAELKDIKFYDAEENTLFTPQRNKINILEAIIKNNDKYGKSFLVEVDVKDIDGFDVGGGSVMEYVNAGESMNMGVGFWFSDTAKDITITVSDNEGYHNTYVITDAMLEKQKETGNTLFINNVSVSHIKSTIELKALAQSRSTESKNVKMIMAAYKGDKLIGINQDMYALDRYTKVNVSITLENIIDYDRIKLFMWDSDNNMYPLVQNIICK